MDAAPRDAPTETEADAMFRRTTSTPRARVSRNGGDSLRSREKNQGSLEKSEKMPPIEHSCSRRALARSDSFAA
jgi:hypothetical protein